MNEFTFAGKSSLDFGICVEHYPVQITPKRKITAFSIPGRDGELHYDEGAYESVSKTYECAFVDPAKTAYTAHALAAWLYGARGKQRLEDSYDPEHFRLASFTGPLEIEDALGRIGKFKAEFLCDPRCYLKSGEKPITVTGSTYIKNRYFDAKPIVKVFGSGMGNVNIGGTVVHFPEIGGEMIIDCENMDAYRIVDGAAENANGDIYAPVFPTLQPGENWVNFNMGVERLEIIPRWWEL